MATESFPVLQPGQVDAVLAGEALVVLDFWQHACPPCRVLEPRLAAFAASHPGAFIGCRVDVDADPDTPAPFCVSSIPTRVALRHGTEIARRDGLIRDAELESLLDATSPDGDR